MQTTSFQGIGPQFTSPSAKRPSFSGSQRTAAPQSTQALQATDSVHFSGEADTTQETEPKDRSFMRKSWDGTKQGVKDAVFSMHALKWMAIDAASGTAIAVVALPFFHVFTPFIIPMCMTLGGLHRFVTGFYKGYKDEQKPEHQNQTGH